MKEIVTILFLFIGSLFALIASIGMVKMPDFFTRIHAAAISSTLSIICILSATAIHFNHLGVSIRCLLIIVLVFITAPTAAHMISRAAYFIGESLWEHTIKDELKGQYDKETHIFSKKDK